MIDIACDLLAELQAAQTRVEHLAQRALDDKRAHDFLKRHSRSRQDTLIALMSELERFDAEQLTRVRMTLGEPNAPQERPSDLLSPTPHTPLTVPTIQTANNSNAEELNRIFDTEIPPPLSNPLTLFIENEEEPNSKKSVDTPPIQETKSDPPKDSKTPSSKMADEAEATPSHTPPLEDETPIALENDLQPTTDLSAQIDTNPTEASVWLNRALKREATGDTVGAISDYLRAAKRSTDAAEIWTKLLALYEKNGLSVKAKQAREKLDRLTES